MLSISEAQITKLEAISLNKFRTNIFKRFREDFPEQTQYLSDKELYQRINDSTQVGVEWEISTESSLSQFVGIAVMLDKYFYKRKEVIDFFSYSGFSNNDKLSIIVEEIIKKSHK